MQWIQKQVLVPRLTYVCHVWGHTLTKTQQKLLRSVEGHALCYYTPMWKTTPTASLQIVLNKKPSHLEVMNVGIRSYICIKKLFQNNFWDGIPNKKRVHSHLATLKKSTHKIIHDGIPLDDFESDYLREASYSWNPPVQDTLMAVNENNIDGHCFNMMTVSRRLTLTSGVEPIILPMNSSGCLVTLLTVRMLTCLLQTTMTTTLLILPMNSSR